MVDRGSWAASWAAMNVLLRPFTPFGVPALLLAAGFVLVYYSAALPPSFAGLQTYGPYLVGAVGAGLAIGFSRGRAVIALIVLAAAYAVQQGWLQRGLAEDPARAVYAALTVLVPLNLAALALMPERGAFSNAGWMRLAAVLLQAACAGWFATAASPELIDWVYQEFLEPAPIHAGRIPQIGITAVAAGTLAATLATLLTRSATSAALAGAILAFAIAAHVPTASVTFSIFTSMAALMVTIAVLQDTFRMAFRDELTGLPSRRALNEHLASLPSDYTVAMIDVDHFKKFNDTYGHDIGDQVLKMVAVHLAEVEGGGRAYRYGGEEFTILFGGKSAAEALPYLEALRKDIEAYRMALRAAGRPRKSKGAPRQKGGWRGKDGVSVTVSIGVAERNERLLTPQSVIEAADRALYRAKDKGRNIVSR
jgi:diguanylate cyclase (GGDEF)-like protein